MEKGVKVEPVPHNCEFSPELTPSSLGKEERTVVYTLAEEKAATPMFPGVGRNSKYLLAVESVSTSSLALHCLVLALFMSYLKTS